MNLESDFAFKPLPDVLHPTYFPVPAIKHPLGPLRHLPGTWVGTGFNQIWRPFRDPAKVGASGPNPPPNQDRFLELNLTHETLEFDVISGKIPNRGLLQPDLNMFGIHYLQQIKDANLHAGLHLEPGIWLNIPATTDPQDPPTVCRMASIPHGTTIVAQGSALAVEGQPPSFAVADITPFKAGATDVAANQVKFPETNLSMPTPFRSSGAQMHGITQAMVDNPNSVLVAAIAGQKIVSMEVLRISSASSPPETGGGLDNTGFLAGAKDGPNAQGAQVDAVFWIEVVEEAGRKFLQLQYTQTVLLNFNGLSWPHVSVATLRKKADKPYTPRQIDPEMPDEIERQTIKELV
jgi:hypothetical protein